MTATTECYSRKGPQSFSSTCCLQRQGPTNAASATRGWNAIAAAVALSVFALKPYSVQSFTPLRVGAASSTFARLETLSWAIEGENELPVPQQQQNRHLKCPLPLSVSSTEDKKQSALCSLSTSEDVMTSSSSIGHASSPLIRETLPPWLSRRSPSSTEQVNHNLQCLECELMQQGFEAADVQEIVTALYGVSSSAADGAYNKLLDDVVSFCRLLVGVLSEEEQLHFDSNGADAGDCDTGLVTKEVLLASILHFAECVDARERGLHVMVQNFLHQQQQQYAAQSRSTTPGWSLSPGTNHGSNNIGANSATATTTTSCCPSTASSLIPNDPSTSIELAGAVLTDTAQKIARGAARIKHAEILAQAVRGANWNNHTTSILWTPEEASRMRGLLLSVMDDWRSLVIRCVACLYRLEGIVESFQNASDDSSAVRSPLVVQTAREALLVYATLAQRLGLHRLKAKIEHMAFSILYRRQYRVVESLFRQKGDAMQRISNYLSWSISQLLHQDAVLMSQVDDIYVTSRVKEPYSFWRKLLKSKKKKKSDLLGARKASTAGRHETQPSAVDGQVESSSLSSPATLQDIAKISVNDGIALRVILKARRWSEEEPDAAVRSRERLLCYYVHDLIRSKFPETHGSRVKDYITHPKPNGYQSLHHTSSVVMSSSSGGNNNSIHDEIELPFEIQIRSEEMHRNAEFGVAAHWDYKLGNASISALNFEGRNTSIVPVTESWSNSHRNDDAAVGLACVAPSSEAPIEEEECSTGHSSATSGLTSSSYLDALITAKQNLLQENVYVFLTGVTSSSLEQQGSILSLPSRSTVADVMQLAVNASTYGCTRDEDIGSPMFSVWKNGLLADLYETVENGDVLVVADGNKAPSALACAPVR